MRTRLTPVNPLKRWLVFNNEKVDTVLGKSARVEGVSSGATCSTLRSDGSDATRPSMTFHFEPLASVAFVESSISSCAGVGVG